MMQAARRGARLAPLLRHASIAPPVHLSVAAPASPIAAHAHAHRHVHATPAAHNFVTRMADQFLGGTAQQRNEKALFDAQMAFFLDRAQVFDGNGYVAFLQTMKSAGGLGPVKEHLPWNAQNPALQDFKDREATLAAMTPAERQNLKLGHAAKKRIAAATGKNLDFVENVLEHISAMQAVRAWVLKRDAAGLPQPKDSAELRAMLSVPGSGLKSKRRAGGGKRLNPGIGKKLKGR